jgi:hypothetical protein
MRLDEFERLKRRVADGLRRADRAAGAEQELQARLRKKYGCRTLDDARRLLKKLERRAADLERELETKAQEFEDDYEEKSRG